VSRVLRLLAVVSVMLHGLVQIVVSLFRLVLTFRLACFHAWRARECQKPTQHIQELWQIFDELKA